MLSQTSEYALRSLLFLAYQEEESAVSAENLATALGAPANYLGKTLNLLVRKGLLTSLRGPGGGFRLARPATEITVAEIVEAVDEPRTRAVCLLGGTPCQDTLPCQAHHTWKAVDEEMWAPLRRTTLSHLLSRPEAFPSARVPVQLKSA